MVRFGTFTPKLAAYPWLMAESKRSLISTGENGAGKTTLNASPPHTSGGEGVTVEEVREVNLTHVR